MIERIKKLAGQGKVCILGFGAEGQSSYRLLQQCLPSSQIIIADKNPGLAEHPLLKGSSVEIQCGETYVKGLEGCSLILKTPGIPFTELSHIPPEIISSQAELFIDAYGSQIIGITGTKGKSTTSSLIFHIIKQQTENVLLVGNIGVPPFNQIDSINHETLIVNELSSHQLENIHYSPHTSILLNLYEEHLDHYHSREDYFMAKMNIALHQKAGDVFIFNAEDAETARIMGNIHLKGTLLPVATLDREGLCCFIDGNELVFQAANSRQTRYDAGLSKSLLGDHNRKNMLFAIAACTMNGIQEGAIRQGLETFVPLAHRLQYAGNYGGIDFYNDSIATIPEATIAAVKALPETDTLILGGFDRGIDYQGLADFLSASGIRNLIFLGAAGKRMMQLLRKQPLSGKELFEVKNMKEAVLVAKKQTAPGKVCLLSPAAASYDMFKNFEERGTIFMQLASA